MPATQVSEQVFQVGPYTLDVRKGTLAGADSQPYLRPKAYSLLVHLAQNMGRVVPKSELMDAVWPGIYVTEDSLTQSIREIRKALKDDEQGLVRTVSRRGYMLTGKADEALDTSAQPIVAVLKFRNESGDPTEDSLVDGFAEEVINGLARFGSVTVLARNSSFAFASYAQPEYSAVAARIGAHYLVEGSVRRQGNKARIAVNLIDAATLAQLWGDRYEADDIGLFSIQQDIGEQIVNRLVTRLDEASIRRAAAKPPASLAAYELVIRAAALLRSYVQGDAGDAKALLEDAIARDPSYGLAYAYLALARVMGAGFGRASAAVLEDAAHLASRAIVLSPALSDGHRVLSLVRLYQRQHAAAEHELRLALELNRCDAESVEQMGYVLMLRGRPLEALGWLDRAIRLNPIYPQFYNYDRSLALYLLGEYREAAAALELSPKLSPWIRTRLAACYAQLGDLEKARAHAARINDDDPAFSAIDYASTGAAFEHASDRDHLVEGVAIALDQLRKA